MVFSRSSQIGRRSLQVLDASRGGSRTGNGKGFDDPSDHLTSGDETQSRVSSMPERRPGMPCKRSSSDDDRLAAPAPANHRGWSSIVGMEAGAPKAHPQTCTGRGRCGKKNGEGNSPTPGNRCVGGPHVDCNSAQRAACLTALPTRSGPLPAARGPAHPRPARSAHSRARRLRTARAAGNTRPRPRRIERRRTLRACRRAPRR